MVSRALTFSEAAEDIELVHGDALTGGALFQLPGDAVR